MKLKISLSAALCLVFLWGYGQRILIIESNSHEYLYFDEAAGTASILSADRLPVFIGIDDAGTMLTLKESETGKLSVFEIDSVEKGGAGITNYFMTDEDGREYMASLNENDSTLIIACINQKDELVMDRYSIDKRYYSGESIKN